MLINNSFYIKPSFGTNHRHFHAGPLKEKIYTTSYVCREDLYFDELVDYMIENYKSSPKVNVYSLACSDGSEAWTLAMFLRERNAHKFLPIKGVDIEPSILSNANSKCLNVRNLEIERLKKFGINFSKYFEPSDKNMLILADSMENETKTYSARDFIKNDFFAERKTILQEVSEMTNEYPKVVLCRNVFPYIGDDNESIYHIKVISEKLAKNDLFVIGDYDRSKRFVENLKNFGFTKVSYNMFKKIR